MNCYRIDQFKKKVNLRTYKIIKNAAYSLGIKGLSVVVGLLLMPVYAKFLVDQSVLGIWITLISMLSWIFTFDLGIGNGLRNELTIAFAQNNKLLAKKLITSAYISSALICFVFAAILWMCIHYIDFINLFHINKLIDEKVLGHSISLLLISVLIQFVLKLINSILLALHRSAIPNALNLLSNILLLLYMLIAPVESINKNFASLSIIYIVTTNLPLLIATIIVFSTSLKDYIPSPKYFNISVAKNTTKLGLAFFGIQIMAMAILNTNNILISIFVNASEVVPFQIYIKLFSLVSTFFSIGMIPIWSSITDAQAKLDFNWIIKIRKQLFLLMGIAAFGEVVVLFLSRFIVTIWMGEKYASLDFKLVIFFAILDLVSIWTMISGYIANGLGKLRNQLLSLTLGVTINFPLAYLFTIFSKSWVAIITANILSLLPFCISETFSTSRYLKRNKSLNEIQVDSVTKTNNIIRLIKHHGNNDKNKKRYTKVAR